ncbi:MAG: sulfatase-like hydrolase/transferase [Planctomycetaceae bacterium]
MRLSPTRPLSLTALLLMAIAHQLAAEPPSANAVASPERSTESAGQPLNVLMIVSDDLNCDLGCYGHNMVQSPNIDRLAQRGVRFSRAYCQYPVCNPSRSSFMTSLYPEQTGVLSNAGNFRKRHPDVVTLPQLFQQRGYWAGRVGKIYHYGVPLQIGTDGEDDKASWDEVVNPRGMDREVHDQIHTLQPDQFGGTLSWLDLDTTDDQQTDGVGAIAAARLLKEHHPEQTGKPFFLAVGFYRPHTPYVAPSHYFDLYNRELIEPTLEQPWDRNDIPPAALADRPKQPRTDNPGTTGDHPGVLRFDLLHGRSGRPGTGRAGRTGTRREHGRCIHIRPWLSPRGAWTVAEG